MTPITTYDTGEVESLWLSINIVSTILTVACIYRPPHFVTLQDTQLLIALEKAGLEAHNLLVFGDFNFPSITWKNCTISDSSQNPAAEFLRMYRNSNLYQLVTFPTRYRYGQAANILDLILTNDANLLHDISSDNPISNSDHVTIRASLHISVKARKYQSLVSRRNFKKADYVSIRCFLQDKLATISINSPDEIKIGYGTFLEAINNSIEMYVPLIKFKYKVRHPWFNLQILKTIKLKYNLWKRYRSTYSRSTVLSITS